MIVETVLGVFILWIIGCLCYEGSKYAKAKSRQKELEEDYLRAGLNVPPIEARPDPPQCPPPAPWLRGRSIKHEWSNELPFHRRHARLESDDDQDNDGGFFAGVVVGASLSGLTDETKNDEVIGGGGSFAGGGASASWEDDGGSTQASPPSDSEQDTYSLPDYSSSSSDSGSSDSSSSDSDSSSSSDSSSPSGD